MKDYASMSDFEINSAVHNALLDKPYELTFHGGGKITWKDKDSGRVIETGIVGYTKNGLHDYSNSPADAWPVISENKISTMWMTSEKEWCAWSEGDLGEGAWYWENSPDYYFNCTSQLRAAMIVFLMMKEGE